MEHGNFSLKVKSTDDSGKFVGLGAVYGNTDLGGDKILPGAFTRTLGSSGKKKVPLLWQHKTGDIIGEANVTDSSLGLMVEGELLMSDPTAQKAYQFLKAGIIKGLSIGFETVKAEFNGDVRELQELKLWEMSVVTFPMNENAQVTSVKAVLDEKALLLAELKSLCVLTEELSAT